MAATLSGNGLKLLLIWRTADGEIVEFMDVDDDITSVIYDCALDFENAEPFLFVANAS